MRSATLGLFFVRKSNGKQRMILDTRGVNPFWVDPAKTCLPTAAAFSNLQVEPGVQMAVEQGDIDNAFYRLGLADGMDEMFVLPCVRVRHLSPAALAKVPELACLGG
eukprot:6460907-Amphidinium_carterae.2